jgi:sugar/nucleoside kinase (ribokinase family)
LSRPELTLIANVALDRVNRGPWTRGGCPTFAPYAFAHLVTHGVINTACANADIPTFRPLEDDGWVSVRFLSAAATTRFDLDYSGEFGETRSMVVHSVGHAWSEGDIDRLEIDTEWVHLAPLLRSDFSVAAVARLAARGHRVAYDGQGMVRVPQLGELRFDAGYDPELLRHLTVLKLSEDEIAVLGAERGTEAVLEALSAVPELLLTHGPRGAEVRAGGSRSRVAPEQAISDVHTTGAGDTFMIAYLIGRGRDLAPAPAATLGVKVAAAMLAERKNERESGEPA